MKCSGDLITGSKAEGCEWLEVEPACGKVRPWHPSLVGTCRCEVDDDAICGALEAGVDDGSFDAVGAFFDGGFGEADQNRMGQAAVRDIDFALDGEGVDAQQREDFKVGKHGAPLNRPTPRSLL